MKNNFKQICFMFIFIFLFGASLSEAQTQTDLTPVGDYKYTPESLEIEEVDMNDIKITVGSDMWEGDKDVPAYVTPMRVTINNNGDTPIAVDYSNFSIKSKDGRVYSALPLYKMEGSIDKLIFDEKIVKIENPFYDLDKFFIYPLYSTVYPSFPFWTDEYKLDNDYVRKYYTWERINVDLPTLNMRFKALPQGVLDKDGIVSGFLYFEKVDSDAGRVDFIYELTNAVTGEDRGKIIIPYLVR